MKSGSNQRIGEKQDDSVKRSNELEAQSATTTASRNNRHVHTFTHGIGHHVSGCCDIGRLIVAFLSPSCTPLRKMKDERCSHLGEQKSSDEQPIKHQDKDWHSRLLVRKFHDEPKDKKMRADHMPVRCERGRRKYCGKACRVRGREDAHIAAVNVIIWRARASL